MFLNIPARPLLNFAIACSASVTLSAASTWRCTWLKVLWSVTLPRASREPAAAHCIRIRRFRLIVVRRSLYPFTSQSPQSIHPSAA